MASLCNITTYAHTERNAILLDMARMSHRQMNMLVCVSKCSSHSHMHLCSASSLSWGNLASPSWGFEVLPSKFHSVPGHAIVGLGYIQASEVVAWACGHIPKVAAHEMVPWRWGPPLTEKPRGLHPQLC